LLVIPIEIFTLVLRPHKYSLTLSLSEIIDKEQERLILELPSTEIEPPVMRPVISSTGSSSIVKAKIFTQSSR
jgi:hypothetical protein